MINSDKKDRLTGDADSIGGYAKIEQTFKFKVMIDQLVGLLIKACNLLSVKELQSSSPYGTSGANYNLSPPYTILLT